MTLCRQTNQLAPVPANADASQIVFESATNQPEAVLYDHVHQGHRTITMPNHLPTARPTLRCYRVARAAAADTESRNFAFSYPGTLGRRAESAIGEHDLAFHGTRRQKFESLSRFKKRERAVDQGIDLLLREECEDLGQIFAQWFGVPPVQHGQLGKYSGRTHKTKSDQRPAPPERADGRTDVGAADRVERVIDTLRFQGTREMIDRPCPIVDWYCAE